MCFLRVFGVFIFTMVMLFRLDWDVYMRGLEGWDTGKHVRGYSSLPPSSLHDNVGVVVTINMLLPKPAITMLRFLVG